MATLGGVPINAPMPYAEEAYIDNAGFAAANNWVGNVQFGVYTMPFSGSLSLALEQTVDWAGVQQVTLQDGATTPTPSLVAPWTNVDYSTTLFTVAHLNMSWASVSAGTIVTVVLQVSIANGGSGVQFGSRTANWRAVRA